MASFEIAHLRPRPLVRLRDEVREVDIIARGVQEEVVGGHDGLRINMFT